MRRFTITAILLLCFTSPLRAQITAQDIVSLWQSQAGTQGTLFTPSRIETTQQGVILHQVTRSQELGPFVATATLEQITLSDIDGAVRIGLPDRIPTHLRIKAFSGDQDGIDAMLSLKQAAITATGMPGDISFNVDIGSLIITVTRDDPAQIPPDTPRHVWTVANISGTLGMRTDGPRPGGMQLQSTFGPVGLTSWIQTIDGATRIDLNSVAGQFDMSDASDPPALHATLTDMTTAIVAENQPMPPLQFDSEQLALDIRAPRPSDAQAPPSTLDLRIGPILVRNSSWDTLDPDAHIDRSAGEVQIGLDLQTRDGAERLTIRDLMLQFGGATLTGTGSLDYFPMPAPTPPGRKGALSLTLTDGLKLLRQTEAAGLVSQNEMMGLQMVLGLFTYQHGTADRLSTDIKIGPGQRLTINDIQVRQD